MERNLSSVVDSSLRASREILFYLATFPFLSLRLLRVYSFFISFSFFFFLIFRLQIRRASSRNNVKQPSLSSLPVSAKPSSTFTRGNKTFRRLLRCQKIYFCMFCYSQLVTLLMFSLVLELYYTGFFSILVHRIYSFFYFM